MGKPADKIFCAIDTPELDRALSLGKALKGSVGGLKLGLEFYSAQGLEGIKKMSSLDLPIFLDLKLHDIPNTVKKAVAALLPLNVKMLTVHTSGGEEMLKAAKDAAGEGRPPPMVLGVTVLTSLDQKALAAMGVSAEPLDQVLRLAGLAKKAGLDGIVCSPLEIAAVRKKYGPKLKLVVPGIRPEGSAAGDQKRVMTPREAVDLGADFLVIGRPITGADDPAKAARAIAQSLAG